MRRTQSILAAVFMLAAAPAWASTEIENARLAARLRVYSQLAHHNLLQITLVVPKGKANLSRGADGAWKLAGDILCLDVGPLRDEIETREVSAFPEEARKNPIVGGDFYRAARMEPPRLLPPDQDYDFDADLNATFARFAMAKLAKKVISELNQSGAACIPDVIAVPAIRFHRQASSRGTQAAWLERMDRGDLVMLGMVSIADLRMARSQRIAARPGERPVATSRGDLVKPAAAAATESVYGALRVDTGRFRTCYVSGEDPLLPLAAWIIADSDKVKRWVKAAPETPKMIADLDAVIAELRKSGSERQCTVLVGATSVLAKVKAALEHEKLAVSLYPETASAPQVLAAFGFRSVAELKFARDIGIDSGEQFNVLRALGLDTRVSYDKALVRYSWVFGSAKPDAETLAAFVRDEREAAAKGMTVKALRAEREKREGDKVRKITTAAR